MKPRTLRHPGRWIWLLLLVPAAIGLVRLRLDVEVFDLLPADLKVVQGLKLYQKHFTNARQLLLTVKASDGDQAENAARAISETLRQHSNLVASVTWEPPWLEHPEQAAELLAYLWFNQPPGVFAELTNKFTPVQLAASLNDTRVQLTTSLSPEEIARLSYDPFGLTRLPESTASAAPSFAQGQQLFKSPDGLFRLIFVQAARELRSYRDCQEWLSSIQPLVKQSLGPAGTNAVQLGYTGRPALVAETAAGMQRDIVISVGGTAAIIAVLFWLAHRRVKPMLWLLTLLAVILACTLALGALIFKTINVVSMGFAAILLGLAVDYAVVHYQEALAHPNLSIPQIRHAIAPSIFWAAVTTITAFLVLNLGGLPGLGQLGTLVAVGVALAAAIMIFEFLPPLFPGRTESMDYPPPDAKTAPGSTVSSARIRAALAITAAALASTMLLLVLKGSPPMDPTANALRPVGSRAYAALEEIQANLNQKQQPLWLIVAGNSVTSVRQRLEQVQHLFENAVSTRLLSGFTLPTALWPVPDHQEKNRLVARYLASQRDTLRNAAHAAGFAPASLVFAERMLDTWKIASQSTNVFWPTNDMSRWILEKVVSVTPTNDFAFGLLTPATNSAVSNLLLRQLEHDLPPQTWLSGWELLGNAIFTRVHSNLWKLVTPLILLVLLSLWFAFRRILEISLSLAALILSALCLLTVMRLAHWSWNLLDLMAIPLVLGTGVDYSIFMQLALRRYQGDQQMAYRCVGRALLLCGGTAIAAFASLAWSSNAGMASLGKVCAVGIAFNVAIAIFLAPVWWHVTVNRRSV